MSHTQANRRKSRRFLWGMIVTIAPLIGIILLVYLPGLGSDDTTRPNSPHKPASLVEPAMLRPKTERALQSQPISQSQGSDKPPELIRVARPRMLEAHPDVAEFRTLEHKVLRTAEEQQKRKKMLSDIAQIRRARDRLLAHRDGPLTREDELERLYRVEYLAAAIEDPNNPALSEAFDAIKDVVLADNIRSSLPLDAQRSLAGDKMELYMALLHDAPDRAAALLAEVQGTPLEALIRYAGQRYQVWTSPKTGEPQ